MIRLATATSVASCLFVCIVRSPVLLAQATATICRCSLVWYSGTGLTPAASAPGVGFRQHPHRDWGAPMSTLHLSCRRLTAEAHLCRDWGTLCHICTGTRQVAAAECGGAYPFASDPAAAADFALRVLRGLRRAPAARGRHTRHTTQRMRAAPTPLVLGEHRRSTYLRCRTLTIAPIHAAAMVGYPRRRCRLGRERCIRGREDGDRHVCR